MRMVDVVECNSALDRHHLFFDNFFTSHRLLINLSDKKVCATGTVRENRTNGASNVMMSKVVMKKKERGYFDFVCDGKVYVAKWNENATVCVASNCLTHEPTHVVRRYVKPNPNQAVTQLHLIHQYNQGMGGVDYGSSPVNISTDVAWQEMVVAAVPECNQPDGGGSLACLQQSARWRT